VPQLGFGGRVVAMLQQMIFGPEAQQPAQQPQPATTTQTN
jgi:hypothetical protein